MAKLCQRKLQGLPRPGKKAEHPGCAKETRKEASQARFVPREHARRPSQGRAVPRGHAGGKPVTKPSRSKAVLPEPSRDKVTEPNHVLSRGPSRAKISFGLLRIIV
ncbi:hypothetical protein E3N88_44965 [Mikania micrantha]|uniref:Uncharacterized protein n=1 Tax=Mikania micrantha TaxID=192012 RepID=A0A5N6LAG6_9ASTR|nr:hypothetical protein E3N88_44965 [Mikania micrantha]